MNPMLSQTSEYALRAIVYLARVARREPVSADVIATALDAPRNYLSKTLNTLAKRGFVSSSRGPAGGFRLAADPDTLTIASVIRAFDEPRERRVCLLGAQPCNDRNPCTAHERWQTVASESWAPLNNTTIADLLNGALADRIPAGEDAGTIGQAAVAAGHS